jgi:hypothetical protein
MDILYGFSGANTNFVIWISLFFPSEFGRRPPADRLLDGQNQEEREIILTSSLNISQLNYVKRFSFEFLTGLQFSS